MVLLLDVNNSMVWQSFRRRIFPVLAALMVGVSLFTEVRVLGGLEHVRDISKLEVFFPMCHCMTKNGEVPDPWEGPKAPHWSQGHGQG